jgi:hypothetical protein
MAQKHFVVLTGVVVGVMKGYSVIHDEEVSHFFFKFIIASFEIITQPMKVHGV